jgi:hypothetical protein
MMMLALIVREVGFLKPGGCETLSSTGEELARRRTTSGIGQHYWQLDGMRARECLRVFLGACQVYVEAVCFVTTSCSEEVVAAAAAVKINIWVRKMCKENV